MKASSERSSQDSKRCLSFEIRVWRLFDGRPALYQVSDRDTESLAQTVSAKMPSGQLHVEDAPGSVPRWADDFRNCHAPSSADRGRVKSSKKTEAPTKLLEESTAEIHS